MQHFEDIIDEKTRHFVGRHAATECFESFLGGSGGILWVVGPPGIGKSAFLAYLAKTKNIPRHFLVAGFEQTFDPRWLLDNLAGQIAEAWNVPWEPPTDLSLHAMASAFDSFASTGPAVCPILLDGIDEAVHAAGEVTAPATLQILLEFLPSVADRQGTLKLVYSSRPDIEPPPTAIVVPIEALSDLEVHEYIQLRGSSLSGAEAAVCEGSPLYLQLLVDEGPSGREGLPQGLEAYFDRLIASLDADALTRVNLLALARGPVDASELSSMAASRRLQIASQAFRKVTTILPDGRLRLFHKGFTDRLTLHTPESTRQQILDWCMRWAQHHASYSLRHLPAHLLEASGETEHRLELYRLAENRAWFEAQRHKFPHEPAMQLETVQHALMAAARADDAVSMARFLILHYRNVMEIRLETPLHALQTHGLEKATRLADLYDTEPCIAWYCLMAWQLADQGKLESARQLLGCAAERAWPHAHGRLLSRLLPQVAFIEPRDIGKILSHVAARGASSYTRIAEEVAVRLGETGQIELAETLLHYWCPEEEARACMLPVYQNRGEEDKVRSVARGAAGNPRDAHNLLRAARTFVEGGDHKLALFVASCAPPGEERDEPLESIVKACIRAREPSNGEEAARQLSNDRLRAEWLGRLSAAYRKVGDIANAARLLSEARQDCSEAPTLKSALALASWAAGVNVDAEVESILKAFNPAEARVALRVVTDLTAMGRTEECHTLLARTAQVCDEKYWHAYERVRRVALMQAELGDLQSSLRTVLLAPYESDGLRCEVFLAQGMLEEALRCHTSDMAVASEYLAKGERDSVVRTLQSAYEWLLAIADPVDRVRRILHYVKFIREHGVEAPVDALLQAGRSAMDGPFSRDSDRSMITRWLVEVWLMLGHMDDAFQLLETLERDKSYISIPIGPELSMSPVPIQIRMYEWALRPDLEISFWDRWRRPLEVHTIGRVQIPHGVLEHRPQERMVGWRDDYLGSGVYSRLLGLFSGIAVTKTQPALAATFEALAMDDPDRAVELVPTTDVVALRAAVLTCIGLRESRVLQPAVIAALDVQDVTVRTLLLACQAGFLAAARLVDPCRHLIEAVVSAAEHLTNPYQSAIVLELLAGAAQGCNEPELSAALLERALERSKSITDSEKLQLFQLHVVRSLLDSDIDRSASLQANMNGHWSGVARRDIARARARTGDTERALLEADQLEGYDADTIRLEVALAWARSSDWDRALGMQRQLRQSLEGPFLSAELAVIAAKEGKSELAFSFAYSMGGESMRRLDKVGDALLQAGDVGTFKKLLIPAAYRADSTFAFCHLLADWQPQHRSTILKLIQAA